MDIDEYIDLAKMIEIGEGYDWSNSTLDKDSTYRLVALSILALEMDYETAVAATIKLAVDNLVLNYEQIIS